MFALLQIYPLEANADDGRERRQRRPQPLPENRPARPAQRPHEQLIARALLRRELVGGRGVGGPIGQVHLLQRESTQFAILTPH